MNILKEILVPKKVFNTDVIKVGMECLLCTGKNYKNNTYSSVYHCIVEDIAYDSSIIKLKETEGKLDYITDNIYYNKKLITPEQIEGNCKYIEFDKSKWDKLIKEADYVDGRDMWWD